MLCWFSTLENVRQEGPSHVELTSRSYYWPTDTRRGPKAGGSLHPLLASGLASPLQPDVRPMPPDDARERDTTTSTTDIEDQHSYHTVQRPPKTAEITPSPIIQRPATPPPSLESPPTAKNVAGEEHCTHAVLPCQHWGRIPSTRVQPHGCHLYKVQGHR